MSQSLPTLTSSSRASSIASETSPRASRTWQSDAARERQEERADMRWISSQFTTRVIVLIPVAIAINIVLGYTVQTVLKLPIYLDSIGTIFVGVLAGPLAGALTGILTNLIWQYAPVIGGGTIGPFAITAAVIGLLAGLWGYLGVYRSRPASGTQLLVAAVIGAAVVILVAYPILNNPAYTDPNIGGYPDWVFTAALVIAVVVAVVVAGFIYLRR